jgi:hypothetical protein
MNHPKPKSTHPWNVATYGSGYTLRKIKREAALKKAREKAKSDYSDPIYKAAKLEKTKLAQCGVKP